MRPAEPIGEQATAPQGAYERLAHYPLLNALIERRSRRFGEGMSLNGGPLAYHSMHASQPLSLEEEAALAFAGCGITGFALADLPYKSGDTPEAGGGNIMTHFVGRTVASGDAMHNITLFVVNDEGVWMLKRPQGYPREEIAYLSQAAREHRLVELYEKSRVRIAEGRHDVPRELPFVAPFNKWAANLPGTTYFLPVAECSALYINILLSAFGEEFCYFVADERNRFKPPGIARFARSRGGHLQDDPRGGRFATVGFLETWLYEFIAIEQGGMLQNLRLMTQALGLGGFPHFAAHPFIWFQALGFRMQEIPFSRTVGAGPLMKRVMRALGKDLPVPTAVGLERNGEVLIKPFCPPYYRNMEEAVLAFVDYKYAQGKGTFRDGGADTGWRDGARVQHGIPPYSDEAIAATVAYCEYVYERYGRFPANSWPVPHCARAPGPPLGPGLLRSLLPPRNAERNPGPASGLVARQLPRSASGPCYRSPSRDPRRPRRSWTLGRRRSSFVSPTPASGRSPPRCQDTLSRRSGSSTCGLSYWPGFWTGELR